MAATTAWTSPHGRITLTGACVRACAPRSCTCRARPFMCYKLHRRRQCRTHAPDYKPPRPHATQDARSCLAPRTTVWFASTTNTSYPRSGQQSNNASTQFRGIFTQSAKPLDRRFHSRRQQASGVPSNMTERRSQGAPPPRPRFPILPYCLKAMLLFENPWPLG